MGKADYRSDRLNNLPLHPETLMMGYGFSPALSEGSLKPPVFLTSTFVFESAQAGKDFFDFASGRRTPEPGERKGLVYSRFNNPNLEILEDRLAVWDGADRAAVFASGMAAIATTFLAFLRPGDVLLHSRAIYGGTDALIANHMSQFGVGRVAIEDAIDPEKLRASAAAAMALGRVSMIYLETPSNPTGEVADLALAAEVAGEIEKAQGFRPVVVVDNTMISQVYQKPLAHGADVALYSLTKYVGGHSDLIAGGVAGSDATVGEIVKWRSYMGTQLDAHSCWMLMRSLETFAIRVERATENARKVAEHLLAHPAISAVHHPDLLPNSDPRRAVYARQCTGAGSTFAFEVKGGEAEAFRFLDRLQIMKLAVSLGGTETLISHPASMTHSGVPLVDRAAIGISDALVRISVGIENADDLIADLDQALAG